MERAAQGADGGGGSDSSSRSSSRATSAGSSPSCSLAGRGVSSRSAAAGLGGGGSRSSPGSVAASPSGGGGRRREPALEGVLSKYTNLLQGWQNRYFVLDFEAGILQYFVNEQSKHQKPRGALSLSGAIVSLSDEAPHMLVVYSANGEMYKLRAADAKEKQFWVTQLRACAKYHMETSSKTTPSSRSRSLTLLPHGTPNPASPCSQRHLSTGAPGVVTITHHKSPAAARRAKSQYPGQLHEVREMMNQVEGQQKNLVHAIESLPGSGPLTALDQDLLLLKATSAATLSCLGECLHLLQQSVHHAGQPSHKPGASENILGWHGPKSHSTEQLKNGTLGSLPSASANITWAILPNSTEDEQSLQPEPEKRQIIKWKHCLERDKISSVHAWHFCSCVWQLPWGKCDPTNEEAPIFIEMGVILTSSGRNSNAPIKMMPVDMMGAVTIYYVAPLNNGFFMWFVLTSAPASHARPLHAPEPGQRPPGSG